MHGVRFIAAEYPLAPRPHSPCLLSQVSPITRLPRPSPSVVARKRAPSPRSALSAPTLKDHGRRFTLSRPSPHARGLFHLFPPSREPRSTLSSVSRHPSVSSSSFVAHRSLHPLRGALLRLAHPGLRFERVDESRRGGDAAGTVGRAAPGWGVFDYSERDSIVS